MTDSAEQLTLQERVLATAMLHQIGSVTVDYTVRDGVRNLENPLLQDTEFDTLVSRFANDPKDNLAYARESLFAITRDDRLTDEDKADRMDRYLDAYFDLTIKLDQAAFPDTGPNEVRKGVPNYIPDGFIDMGGDGNIDPKYRGREQIWVDKRAILDANKDVLKHIFMTRSGEGLQDRKLFSAVQLAQSVYANMKYNGAYVWQFEKAGDKKKLSEMEEGICRHQALSFQVLAQAMGLESRVSKCRMDGGRHAANMVRVNRQWYILDATNPDHVISQTERSEWRPGVYKIDKPPQPGQEVSYTVTELYSGRQHVYETHDDMYWRVEHP